MWHKAVLLISAAPITVFMNSVRIAIAGIIVQYYGLDWLEGFTHFFEGWVIFIACILILFALARIMLFFNARKMGLAEALDLDTDGLGTQAARLHQTRASGAMIVSALLMVGASLAWQAMPDRSGTNIVQRESLALFPRRLGDWQQSGPDRQLGPAIQQVLGADDYLSRTYANPDAPATVEFFTAWYDNQSRGGVHSPEICLPGAGWEIAWLERSDLTENMGWDTPFKVNRAVIQKGETRMMVYYWFDQKGRKIAWDIAAKYWLMVDGIRTGRTDGALVRLTTPILAGESDADADARLMAVLRDLVAPLPRFLPEN